MAASKLSSAEASNVKSFFQADNYGNDASIETQWAMKAFQHAETHFNIIKAVDTTILRLTRIDDEIYTKFKEDFPDFNLHEVDEEKMKSKDGKEKWREFCESFKGRVEDYSMGTLLRIDPLKEPTDKNTILAHRIQFLAIEIARNREGINSPVRNIFGKKTQSSPDSEKMAETATDKSDKDNTSSEKS